VGYALAASNRTLVYGGGSNGIMGVVSGAVLEKRGKVIGVIPHAMVAAGGEKDKVDDGNPRVPFKEVGREMVCIVFSPNGRYLALTHSCVFTTGRNRKHSLFESRISVIDSGAIFSDFSGVYA
jgi:hypothetical protein